MRYPGRPIRHTGMHADTCVRTASINCDDFPADCRALQVFAPPARASSAAAVAARHGARSMWALEALKPQMHVGKLADSALPAGGTGAGRRTSHVHGPYDGQGALSVCDQQHVLASVPGALTAAAASASHPHPPPSPLSMLVLGCAASLGRPRSSPPLLVFLPMQRVLFPLPLCFLTHAFLHMLAPPRAWHWLPACGIPAGSCRRRSSTGG